MPTHFVEDASRSIVERQVYSCFILLKFVNDEIVSRSNYYERLIQCVCSPELIPRISK